MDPKPKPEHDHERPKYGPHPDDVDLFTGDDEPEAEGEAVIRWLEGEGEDPWREPSS